MNFKLEKLQSLSGRKASIYTVLPENSSTSLFDDFLHKNMETYEAEVLDILDRIKLMADKQGALPGYFKKDEGKLGDLVCALYDRPGSNLRLYCIRFGKDLIVLGGGGPKSKSITAWQEDADLTRSANEMIAISKLIYQRLKDKDIKWSSDYMDFTGDLDFNEDEQ